MKQSDTWSCMACVAAMIANEPLQNVIDFIGHDGSDWDPNSKSPFRVAGFSIKEIAKFFLDRDFLLGTFFIIKDGGKLDDDEGKFPVAIPLNHLAMVTVKSERFHPNIKHVIYWDGKKVWDSNPEVEDGRPLTDYYIYEWWPILRLI